MHFENRGRTEHEAETEGRLLSGVLSELRFDLDVTLFRPFRKMIQKHAKVLF